MGEEERAITPTYELEGGNLELDDVQVTKSNIEPKNLLGVCCTDYFVQFFFLFSGEKKKQTNKNYESRPYCSYLWADQYFLL